jgi:hypothetical protein
MFTIKLYSDRGYRQRILEAESFSILRGGADDGGAEITLHQKNPSDDVRFDITPDQPREPHWPQAYQKAIIENAAGKTTEIISLRPATPALPPLDDAKPAIAA